VLANCMRALRGLGLDRAVARNGFAMRRWGYSDARGELLCETDLESLWGDVGACVGVERTKLIEVLLGAATGVRARHGVTVSNLAQASRWVSVGFTDGSSADYDLVVGADGIRSTIRRLAFGGPQPTYSGQVVWRAVIPTRFDALDGMQLLMGDGRFFGLLPVGDGQTYGFAGLDAPEPPDNPLRGGLGTVRQLFASFSDAVAAFLAALECDEQLRFDPIEWVDADRWHTGGVLLIGDAAHAGPPHMGQGGCMALEDAVVLAEVLHEAATVDDALAAFEVRRRPRTDWVQEQSRAALRFWLLPPQIRDAALRQDGEHVMHMRYAPLRSAA
jgi:FAD-dependent urate hydroxylase